MFVRWKGSVTNAKSFDVFAPPDGRTEVKFPLDESVEVSDSWGRDLIKRDDFEEADRPKEGARHAADEGARRRAGVGDPANPLDPTKRPGSVIPATVGESPGQAKPTPEPQHGKAPSQSPGQAAGTVHGVSGGPSTGAPGAGATGKPGASVPGTENK